MGANLRKKTDKTKCFVSFLIEARRKRINDSSRRENMNYHELATNVSLIVKCSSGRG